MREKMSQVLYALNEEAIKYYHSVLKGDQGEAGVACLKGLGLIEET